MRALGALLWLAGCFSPRFEECAITCATGCPSGWECGDDGHCHEGGGGESCATNVAPDASPEADAAVDAEVTSPDAGCTRVSLLGNGSFDTSTGTGLDKDVPGWSSAPRPVSTVVMHDDEVAVGARSPSYHAWVTGPLDQTNNLCADLAVPAGATELEVRFFLHLTTTETTTTAVFDEMIVRADSAVLFTFSNLDANDGYVEHSTRLPIGGPSEVTLCFEGRSDSAFMTVARVDDVEATATLCQ